MKISKEIQKDIIDGLWLCFLIFVLACLILNGAIGVISPIPLDIFRSAVLSVLSWGDIFTAFTILTILLIDFIKEFRVFKKYYKIPVHLEFGIDLLADIIYIVLCLTILVGLYKKLFM